MTYTRKALATRKRIIDSAEELIFNKGFSNTKLDEVLRAARIQKGNFYYYFESKDDLGIAVIRERGRVRLKQWLDSMVDPASSPLENLRRLIKGIAGDARAADSVENPLGLLVMDLNEGSADFKTELSSFLQAIIDTFKDELVRKAGMDQGSNAVGSRDMALFVFSVLQGAIVLYKASGNEDQLRSTSEFCLRVISDYTISA